MQYHVQHSQVIGPGRESPWETHESCATAIAALQIRDQLRHKEREVGDMRIFRVAADDGLIIDYQERGK